MVGNVIASEAKQSVEGEAPSNGGLWVSPKYAFHPLPGQEGGVPRRKLGEGDGRKGFFITLLKTPWSSRGGLGTDYEHWNVHGGHNPFGDAAQRPTGDARTAVGGYSY